MQKRITFRDMPHSDVMEQYANGQLDKIVNFLTSERSPIYLDLVFEPSKVREHHRIELRLKSPHYDLVSHYEGAHFYDVLDRVIDTMYRELRNLKDRHMEDRKMVGRHEDFKKQR
jgi:ribosomal subunit interface protein